MTAGGLAQIRADFDRIARLDPEPAPLSGALHRLLNQLPPAPCDVLDLGCGTGAVAAHLTVRGYRVVACDCSLAMLETARRSAPAADLCAADMLQSPWRDARFDAIVAVAVLHHADWNQTLPALRRMLRPGGVLLVQDLWRIESPVDVLVAGVAWITSRLGMRLHGRRKSPAVNAAWRDHGHHDVYPSMREIRRLADTWLPGATITRQLYWRFNLVWRMVRST